MRFLVHVMYSTLVQLYSCDWVMKLTCLHRWKIFHFEKIFPSLKTILFFLFNKKYPMAKNVSFLKINRLWWRFLFFSLKYRMAFKKGIDLVRKKNFRIFWENFEKKKFFEEFFEKKFFLENFFDPLKDEHFHFQSVHRWTLCENFLQFSSKTLMDR